MVSKVVASCQGRPPWATGVMPAALSFSAVALNSSQVVGMVAPTFASTCGFAHSQLTRWMLTGTATYLPSCLTTCWIWGGRTLSQPSAPATASSVASEPCSAQSWMFGPLSWTAFGGLPASTRERSTVLAASPPPPATGASCHLPPAASKSCFRTATAFDSPPEVQ
jgi:hypothetical protein